MSSATTEKAMRTTGLAKRVARKQYRCDWCNEVILPGDRYIGWTQFDDVPSSTRLHPECMEAFKESDETEFDNLNPRGCNCDWDDLCARCKERRAAAEHICENCRFWAAPVIPDDTGECQRLHTGLTDGDAFENEDWAQTEATDTCNRWMLSHDVLHRWTAPVP
jgi:hypothetical protein